MMWILTHIIKDISTIWTHTYTITHTPHITLTQLNLHKLHDIKCNKTNLVTHPSWFSVSFSGSYYSSFNETDVPLFWWKDKSNYFQSKVITTGMARVEESSLCASSFHPICHSLSLLLPTIFLFYSFNNWISTSHDMHKMMNLIDS